MKLQRFDMQGCAWESSEGLPPPTIYADITKSLSECIGIRIGVSCVHSSSNFNAHEIADDEDSIFFPRLQDEPYWMSREAPSLVRRCALEHGTERAWRLIHS